MFFKFNLYWSFTFKDGHIDVKSKKRNKKKRKREKAEAKNVLYAGFTKSATLTDGHMIEESSNTAKKEQDSSSEDEMDKFSAVTKLLSDENLFKAAGITAHKGARHGKNQSKYAGHNRGRIL